jgi:hypothetical protein
MVPGLARPARLLRHFAGHFGIEAEEGGANLGLDHLIDRIRVEPRRFSLLPADKGYGGCKTFDQMAGELKS